MILLLPRRHERRVLSCALVRSGTGCAYPRHDVPYLMESPIERSLWSVGGNYSVHLTVDVECYGWGGGLSIQHMGRSFTRHSLKTAAILYRDRVLCRQAWQNLLRSGALVPFDMSRGCRGGPVRALISSFFSKAASFSRIGG